MWKDGILLSVLSMLFLFIFRVEAKNNLSAQRVSLPLKPCYVIAPEGSDENPGTSERPFATIQKAADMVKAGDIVLIKAGLYNEHIVLRNSGAPGKPIIFMGERGPDGSWLTNIATGIPVTDWSPAPEIGEGVYKTTSIPFNPYCITVDGKQLLRIKDGYMALDKGKLLPYEKLKQIKGYPKRQEEGIGGFNLLRLPADATVKDSQSRPERSYWGGIEALYGYIDGVTYIRFRNGDNPSKIKNIYASQQGTAILIDNLSYIIIRDLSVSRADTCIVIQGEKATDNIVEKSFLSNGRSRIRILDKAARNIIQNNRLTLNYYGFRSPDGSIYKLYSSSGNVYREFKRTQGANSSDDVGISIRLAGIGNIIRNNRIYYGLIGINTFGVKGVEVYRNIINDMYSIGLCTSPGTNGVFYENLIFSNGINLRIHCYNAAVTQTSSIKTRNEYYYRNFFYSPNNSGQVFIHYYPSSYIKRNKIQYPDEEPEIFFYHNTFVGGQFNVSARAKESAGMEKTVIVNNVCSFSKGSAMTGYLKGIWDIPKTFEAVDYNWLVAPEIMFDKEFPSWLYKNNIFSTTPYKWERDSLFNLLKDSPFREKGIDLSKKFIINGKEYGPLPGMKPGYFKNSKPDLGALQLGEDFDPIMFQALKEERVLPDVLKTEGEI